MRFSASVFSWINPIFFKFGFKFTEIFEFKSCSPGSDTPQKCSCPFRYPCPRLCPCPCPFPHPCPGPHPCPCPFSCPYPFPDPVCVHVRTFSFLVPVSVPVPVRVSVSVLVPVRVLVPVPVLVPGNNFRIRISPRIRNRIRTKFWVWIRDPYGVDSWKKNRRFKISCYNPFKARRF
jgi:hypothetical protein